MKKILNRIGRAGVVLALLALFAPAAIAQTTVTSTTLSAAVTSASATKVGTVQLASGTGVAAGSFLFVDRELMLITDATSTTQPRIQRGVGGSLASTHASGAVVFVGVPGAFYPNEVSGSCTAANETYLPHIVPQSGRIFQCLNSLWQLVPRYQGYQSAHPSLGVGYATGAGCAVTQATSKSTGVTCTGLSGAITLNAANLAATTSVGFTVTDTSVAAGDTVILSIKSGATANSYQLNVDAVAAGSFNVSLRNYTAGGLAEAVVINFVVIKGASS